MRPGSRRGKESFQKGIGVGEGVYLYSPLSETDHRARVSRPMPPTSLAYHYVPTLIERVRLGDPLTAECDVVSALEQAIIQRIGTKRYQVWFEQHSKFERNGDVLV